MTKNVRLQVMFDMQEYLELANEVKAYKLNPKTESDLVRKVCIAFTRDMPVLKLENEQLKTACSNKNAVIDQLRREIAELKGVKIVPVKS